MNPVRMFRRDRAIDAAAQDLLGALVMQARAPAFYSGAGVPDTLDGRYEMIALHLVLLLRRLRREPADRARAAKLSQALFDAVFASFDENLREMGVGDLSVGGKVKAMVQGFYGRAAAYENGLVAAGDEPLHAAVRRNLFGTLEPQPAQVEAMAEYLRREDRSLAAQSFADLASGRVRFGLPAAVG